MKNLYPLNILSFFIYFLGINSSLAQAPTIYAHNALAEKIYLQLDGKVYTTDQTIWYKCVVSQANDHRPSPLSGVLYVELINPDEQIVEKKLIKIRKGIGKGFFVLNKQYIPGQYLIRAYTEWNKNFETDFFFEEYIRVFDSSPEDKLDPIRNITLLEKENKIKHLQALLDPLAIDSLHKKKVNLFVTVDGKKDSLSIKKNKAKKYLLDYPITAEAQFVTLQMSSKNRRTHSKTLALDEDYLDLQFFPESGEMVHGLKSKIGFKALDYTGKGKKVSGEILDEKGDTIAFFDSNTLGMGIFTIPKVDKSKTYYASLESQKEIGLSIMRPLPKAVAQGNILSVVKVKNNIHIQATSNYLQKDSIRIQVACRGKGYYDVKGRLKAGKLIFTLDAQTLPEGILAFTMMDYSGQTVAERLYFNERPETRLDIKVASNKTVYKQREKTELNIAVLDKEGKPSRANLSLLVINKKQLGEIQQTRENILSYFLLSSDLKGEIENPSFYFRKDRLMFHHLDALMLTQGWRKYHYTRPLRTIIHQPEMKLTVAGKVSGLFSKKNKKEVLLTMATFGETKSFQTQVTDSLGRFEFDVDEEYGQKLNVLIQSAKKSGKKLDYTITIDKKETPAIEFNHVKSLEKVDSVIQFVIEKNMERKEIDDAAVLSDGAITLDEVVVSDYRLTPQRKKVLEYYGKPDAVIEGEEIMEKEEKWSYGLYSVIKFHYPDLIKIWDLGDFLYAEVQNSLGPTLVVIDGIAVRDFDYPLIPNIPTSSVSSFEIIKNSIGFRNHFLDVFPHVHPLDAPGFGNILAIYTYAGKGLHSVSRTAGMFKTAVPIFAPSYEFYAPKHSTIQADDWYRPDLRALVHWEPIISVDNKGKATTSFYNADNLGEMQIVIEAISENGEIAYKELFYDVEKY